MKKNIKQAFLRLWEQTPALCISIPVTLGSLFALEKILALFLLPLFLLTVERAKIPQMTLLFLLPLPFIHIPHSSVEGKGTFIVDSISASKSHFKNGYCHRGRFSFDEKKKGCNLPCFVFASEELSSFRTEAIVTPKNRGYHLITTKRENSDHFSLLKYRLKAKKWVKTYIQKRIKNREAAQFLIGIFAGEMEDKLMLSNFSKLGLTHLLAISGLHFALITLFFRKLLFFLPNKLSIIALLLIVTSYYLFIGNSPSVQRAWIFTLIVYSGQLFDREGNSLNTLGVALLIATMLNPFSLLTLSFQLTFLATAGLILFYHPRKKPLKMVLKHSTFWQVGFICSTLLKRSFLLTAAVHLFILPLLLFRFHNFCPHTVFYNLFFPTMASFSLLLLLLGFIFPPLHIFNSYYTGALLWIVENPPLLLPGLFFESVPLILVIFLTLTILTWGIHHRFSSKSYI